MEWIIDSEETLSDVAKHVLEKLPDGGILFLKGEMGAGKTTFVRHFAQELHCKDHVNSPTFALINKYTADKTIYHMDFYRLEQSKAIELLDLETMFDQPHTYFCIEWPTNYTKWEAFTLPYVTVTLAYSEEENATETTRHISVAS